MMLPSDLNSLPFEKMATHTNSSTVYDTHTHALSFGWVTRHDGEKVAVVEVEEFHDPYLGKRRIMLSQLIHLVRNVKIDELLLICEREPDV